MPRWNQFALPAVTLASLVLAGCAVTPNPLDEDRLGAIASDKLDRVTADQEPIGGTVDLYEAIARALKYNLDHQVEIAEQAVRRQELRLAHFALLPTAVANSGYNARDKVNASSSTNILTGAQSLATSTSQEQRIRTSDAAFGWNVLDFGLSYIRARQSADRVLIQQELRRKITLRIIEDVRAVYWRAVSAQRLHKRLRDVEVLAREVEAEARQLARSQETSAVTALTYEREVVEVQQKLAEVARELNTAKIELGALMNVAPGTSFRLADARRSTPHLPKADMSELLHLAVANRPELKEVEYRRRINEQEAHAALLELLPGFNLFAGENFDSNSFLYASHWSSWGARASWNLIKVFSYPTKRELIEEQDTLLDKRSLAVTMAIMTQVYVSRIRYAHAMKEHDIALRYRNVQQNLLLQIRAEAAAGRVSRQTLAREELNAVIAEAKLDLRYASVQAAWSNINSSLGLEPLDIGVAQAAPVAETAAAMRSRQSLVTTASMAQAEK